MRIQRLMIVDDNRSYLLAARDLLQREGLNVVAIASNGADAMRLAAETNPDVALVDIDLGPESGFDVAGRLVAERPMRAVLISAYEETEFGDLVETSAAAGFIAKTELSAAKLAEVLGRDGTGRGS